MNETSSFKKGKKEPLIDKIEEELIKDGPFPLNRADRGEREDALVFEVFDPKGKTDINIASDQNNSQYKVMFFKKKKKKSNKD